MKRWKLPNLFKIASASEFFTEMTSINRASITFSQRELAKFLKWPASYVPDVIKGGKPFTVTRSLEFVRAFRVHPIDAEQLIFLAVASQSKADLTDLEDLRLIKSPAMREKQFAELTIFNFEALLICEAVALLGPNADRAKIEFLVSGKNICPEKVNFALKLLVEKELVKETKSGFTCVMDKSYSNLNFQSSEMRKLQQAFLDSAKSFFNDSFRPATGSSAFVVIKEDRYNEVREKLLSLKNWILEVSALDSAPTQADGILFQMELHLLPLFRPERLKEAKSLNSGSGRKANVRF